MHRALGTASRAAILRLIRRADTGLTATDVVAQVGLHPSTVRAHLEQLVDAGLLVKARASHGAPGRPAWHYRAAEAGPAAGPYQILAAAFLDHLAGAGADAPMKAGEQWGRRLAAEQAEPGNPVELTVNVLAQLGFEPRRLPAGGPEPAHTDIHLHACPFLDLVGPQPDVMCALHAGMIRGIVHRTGIRDAHVVLEPFAAPTACVVRMQLPKSHARGET